MNGMKTSASPSYRKSPWWMPVVVSLLGCSAPFLFFQAGLTAQDEVAQQPSPIENVHWINPELTSGAGPVSETDFEYLKELGFKTIVSVDGEQPNVLLAKEFGLRYVHVPLPYSGIPVDSSRQLTKVMAECEKPIYIHCHHGLHRGPAAAAICGIVQGHFTNDAAVQFLHDVGTDPAYVGLYRDVHDFRPVNVAAEAKLNPVELVESAPIDELSAVMLRVEKQFQLIESRQPANTLSKDQKAPWIAIVEELKEAGRLQKENPELQTAFQKAAQIVHALSSGESGIRADAVQILKQQCVSCHVAHRSD